MSALTILDGGIGNTIQDLGRFGFRHMGVGVSGCLDTYLARSASALVGNDSDAACIEIRAAGPCLQVTNTRLQLAVAGNVPILLRRATGATEEIPCWKSVTLMCGDSLEIGFIASGVAYLALAGGVASPVQLGSRSTYQRALIGGVHGGPLRTGDVLPLLALAKGTSAYAHYFAAPWCYEDAPIRVILGPQDGHFKPESIAALLNSPYQVTKEMDRMGMRLEGTPLVHVTPKAADIVSDGVTLGALQVPGNGQPIILLADCQTVGGYPKVATVISADIPRLAQLRAGQSISFNAVTLKEARAALLEREKTWQTWQRRVCFGLPEVLATTQVCDSDGAWYLDGASL